MNMIASSCCPQLNDMTSAPCRLQALEEEQAQLRRAEARAAELAAKATSQPGLGHDEGAAAVAARKAAEAVAVKRRLVDGPQALQIESAPEVGMR